MDLYASPMACSLAAHIAALEAGVPFTLRYLDLGTKRTDDGEDYRAISANGYVPALRLPDGTVLDEGPAVLQWIADQRPASGLAPPWSSVDRYRLIAALNFLSTEVHKKVFARLVGANATEQSRAATRGLVAPTLDRIAARLGEREVLVGKERNWQTGRTSPRTSSATCSGLRSRRRSPRKRRSTGVATCRPHSLPRPWADPPLPRASGAARDTRRTCRGRPGWGS
jgi:glutathione S-transferase